MREALLRLVLLAGASAYFVGLVELARWLGGLEGILVAVATPAAGAILLALLYAEVRKA